NFLDSQVGVVAPNRERTVIDLEQVAPGRYRGRFPAAQEGVYLVGMSQRRNDRVVGSQLAGLVVPYAQELRDLGVDETLLRELAELTGGGAVARQAGVVVMVRLGAWALGRGAQGRGGGVAECLALGLAQRAGFVQIERGRLRAGGRADVWSEALVSQSARAARADAALFGRIE